MSDAEEAMLDFAARFNFEHGRLPNGRKQHYCLEWDLLPIDDSCKEIECCICIIPERKERGK